MTRPAFERLSELDTPFLCSYCVLVSQNKEISRLANIIEGLNSSIITLTETIRSHVTKSSAPAQLANAKTNATATNKTNTHENLQQDRKFNVVFYGIDECPKGTPT